MYFLQMVGAWNTGITVTDIQKSLSINLQGVTCNMAIRVEDLHDGDTITAEQFRAYVDAEQPTHLIEGVKMAPKLEKAPRKHPERDFQRQVIEVARSFGWTDFHVLRSKGMRGGFPDLFLIRPPNIVWAELKAENGKLSDAQKDMYEMLKESLQNIYVWYPDDMPEIIEVLK